MIGRFEEISLMSLIKRLKKSFLLLIPLLLNSPLFAEDLGTGTGFTVKIFPERQQERQQSRWSLEAWKAQRRIMDQQDLWLWQHTNRIPFEFAFIAGQSQTQSQIHIDAFIARVGIFADYDKSTEFMKSVPSQSFKNESGQFGLQLRLFGGNLQDTHLLLRGGYDYDHLVFPNPGNYGGWSFGPELQIYFARWLGIRGSFTQYLERQKITSDAQKIAFGPEKFSGGRYDIVAFLEVEATRLEGGWISRNIRFKSTDQSSSFTQEGAIFRLGIFY